MSLTALWHELTRLALLGAARNPLPAAVREALAQLDIDLDAPDTELVLEGLARVRVLLRAKMPLSHDRDWPLDAAPIETATVCSRKSIYHLGLILEGEFAEAMPEFAALLHTHRQLLPPEQLHILLERSRETPSLFPLLTPLLGERGRWLLTQNSAWAALAPTLPDHHNWPILSTTQKQQAIAHWRQQDATAARVFLQQQWTTLKAKEQEKIIVALQEGLSPADESFLQTQLATGRKGVREAAALLLAQLPESSIARHLRERVAPCLSIEKGQLVVTLPESLPDEAFTEGIPTRSLPEYGGQKLSWLGWQLERIPPAYWTDQLGQQPATLLQLMGRSREAQMLLYAIAGATLLYKDATWQLALLTYYLQVQRPDLCQTDRAKELMRTATAGQMEQLDFSDLPLVVANPTMRDHPLALLLEHNPQPWSETRSLAILRAMQEALARRPDQVDLRAFLALAAYRVAPSLLPRYHEGWPQLQGVAAYNFQWAQQKFLRTVTFRLEMTKAITA